MGLFTGIEDADLFQRGKFLTPDFVGVLEVKKTLAFQTRKVGMAFIAEFTIIESNKPEGTLRTVVKDGEESMVPDAFPVGTKCTWFQKLADKDVAFPAIKSFVAALSGYQLSDKNKIDEELSPHLADLLDTCTESPEDNQLVGLRVDVITTGVVTKNNRDFTRHDWDPHVYAAVAETQTDAD